MSQRVYLVICFCPCSPSFANSSSFGMITVSSCMMIEAVMYGMIPEREQGDPPQRAARKQVEKTDDAAAALGEELLERVDVDARYGHVGAETVDRDHRRREEYLGAKLRKLPGVDE